MFELVASGALKVLFVLSDCLTPEKKIKKNSVDQITIDS